MAGLAGEVVEDEAVGKAEEAEEAPDESDHLNSGYETFLNLKKRDFRVKIWYRTVGRDGWIGGEVVVVGRREGMLRGHGAEFDTCPSSSACLSVSACVNYPQCASQPYSFQIAIMKRCKKGRFI